MKKFAFAACLAVLVLASPTSALASTLDALPEWKSPHAIVHAEDLPGALARLGDSFLLDALLDARPEREPLLEWLKAFPTESVSLVRGVMLEDEDTFQGAVRFAPSAREVLLGLDDAVAAAMLGEDARESLGKVFFDLLNVPKPLREKGVVLRPSEPEEGETVYELDVELFGMVERTLWVTVGHDGTEPILLFGSTPEDVERAREALAGEGERMTVVRRDERNKSFVQINDDANGGLIREILDGLPLEPKAPVFVELSLGSSEGEIDMSLRHNVFDAVLGSAKRPVPALSVSKPGLKSGEGVEKPWFAGALGFALSAEDILSLMAFISESEKDEALAVLREQNIDPAVLTEAFRSVGVVLGGASELRGTPMPGGYAFLSGVAEKTRKLLPLFRAFVGGQLSHSFDSAERPGWDAFYSLNEEMREELGAPMAIGMKDGTLLMGCLSEAALDEAPGLFRPDAEGEKKLLLYAALDLERVYELFVPFLSSVPGEALEDFIDELDLDGFLDLESLAALSQALAGLQEAQEISISAADWESVELLIRTGEADLKKARELSRLSKKLLSALE